MVDEEVREAHVIAPGRWLMVACRFGRTARLLARSCDLPDHEERGRSRAVVRA